MSKNLLVTTVTFFITKKDKCKKGEIEKREEIFFFFF